MALDYSSLNVRKQIIDRIKSNENKLRKATSLRQYRCYSDQLDQYVQERLLQTFSVETYKMMPVISSINLVKRICDQSATIYNMPPKRTFTELTEEQQEVVDQIYLDGQFDNKYLRANRLYCLQNQSHLFVRLKAGKIELVPLLLHNIDVIPKDDNPEEADCYVIANFDREGYTNSPSSYTQNSSTGYVGSSQAGYLQPSAYNGIIADNKDYKASLERYTFWSAEYNFVCDGTGAIVGDDPSDIKNDIGVIPIIDIYSNKDFTYFVETGSGVVEFSIDYNVAMSDLMFISRLQGFSQAVITGDKETLDKMTTMQFGPTQVIKLPLGIDGSNTDMKFLSRNSDIAGSMAAIEMLLSNFLTSKGIDPKVVSGKSESTKFASGTERLLAMIERFESSRSDYDLFKATEAKVWAVVKAYLNAYSTSSDVLDEKYRVSLPAESEISVQFGRPELVQGEQEKVATIVQKMDAGLYSKVDAIMELKDISREMAEEKIEQIATDNKKFVELISNGSEDNEDEPEGLPDDRS